MIGYGKALAAFGAAGVDYPATRLGGHPLAETVLVHAATVGGLKRSFHLIAVLLFSVFGVQSYAFHFIPANHFSSDLFTNIGSGFPRGLFVADRSDTKTGGDPLGVEYDLGRRQSEVGRLTFFAACVTFPYAGDRLGC